MTKEEAIAFVIAKTEEIEKERVRVNLSIDATRQKKGVVYAILKVLEEVTVDDENL